MPASSERPVFVLLELGFVGDSIMTLPAMSALRRAQPEAHVVRVVNQAMSELWEDCPLCDRILAFDRKRSKWGAGRALLQDIRALKPTVFANLHTPDRDRPRGFYWRDALFARASGASRRLGWSHGLDRLLLTDPVPRVGFGEANMAIEVGRVLAPVSGALELDGLTYWHDDGHRREAASQLSEGAATAGIAWPSRFVAVSPFGKLSAKELEGEEFAALLRELWDVTRLPAVVLGGPADVEKMTRLRPRIRTPCIDLVGRNGLKVAAAILEQAAATLAVDSGLMHLASLVGTPVVALFGPMPSHRWRPFRSRSLSIFEGRTSGMPRSSASEPFDLAAIAAAVQHFVGGS